MRPFRPWSAGARNGSCHPLELRAFRVSWHFRRGRICSPGPTVGPFMMSFPAWPGWSRRALWKMWDVWLVPVGTRPTPLRDSGRVPTGRSSVVASGGLSRIVGVGVVLAFGRIVRGIAAVAPWERRGRRGPGLGRRRRSCSCGRPSRVALGK